MSEQKKQQDEEQSLADFVFENKDKMSDNIYKTLMEKYAKKDADKKGYVEVEYAYPAIVPWGDGGEHKLLYKRRIAITKKYYGRDKEIKVGLCEYIHIVKCAYDTHQHLIDLISSGEEDEGYVIKYCGNNINLFTDSVFILSVKDI